MADPRFGGSDRDYAGGVGSLAGGGGGGRNFRQFAQDQWDANRRYSQAQMLMNEPGARAKEVETAGAFGGNIREFIPHLQQGFNTATDPARATQLGWAGNWPGTPLGYSMGPKWNYTVVPDDPFDYTTRSGGGDQAYMEPGPWGPWGPWGPEFPKPRPGGEWPRPGELVGETDDLSDMAANSPEYLKFKSLRRKFGSQKAIEMMGMNVNRGGIMGLI